MLSCPRHTKAALFIVIVFFDAERTEIRDTRCSLEGRWENVSDFLTKVHREEKPVDIKRFQDPWGVSNAQQA